MLKQVQLKISPQKRVILETYQKDQGPSENSEQRLSEKSETDPDNRLLLLEKCLSNKISDECKKLSHEWSNKCVYKCKLCKPPTTLSSISSFQHHLKRAHLMLGSQYLKKFGGDKLATNVRQHQCAICNRFIEHDNYKIGSHFYQSQRREQETKAGDLTNPSRQDTKSHAGLTVSIYYTVK